MNKGAVLFISFFVMKGVFAQYEVATVLSPEDIAKEKAVITLKERIEEEKANFTIRHYINLAIGEQRELWPAWETGGRFYRAYIAPHIPKESFSSGLAGSAQAAMLYSKKPLVLAKISTEEQSATLSELQFIADEDSLVIQRSLYNYEITTYEGTKKNRTVKKTTVPTIFKTTTGAKVKKVITPGGVKQTIVAYTQPGIYTPVLAQQRRVSQEFAGAVLYDFVYFNQGDGLHRTLGSDSDLGKKELIGTMNASGGCARLSSKDALFAREKISSAGLAHSRVQVVETDDVLSCTDSSEESLKTYNLYLASDRTSGVLVESETTTPLFVGLRGETSWKASSAGRNILLSTMPEYIETALNEAPKIEVTYLTLNDKSPFKAFGQEYSVTMKKQVLSLKNVTSKFKFEELGSYVKTKEDVQGSQLSLNCKKIN